VATRKAGVTFSFYQTQTGHEPNMGLWPVRVLLLGLSALDAVEAFASSPERMRRSQVYGLPFPLVGSNCQYLSVVGCKRRHVPGRASQERPDSGPLVQY
jgi:hypothetical protein